MESPSRLENAAGLRIDLNANGSVRRMDCGDITLNLFLGNEMEGGPANIYLRSHAATVQSTPLLGPRSPSRFAADETGFIARGEWEQLRYTLRLALAADSPAWFWLLSVENGGADTATVDLLYAQDLALAHYGAVRLNEYYVSQYLDYTPLRHTQHGLLLAVRQNLAMAGRNPWLMCGCLGEAVSFATDALQLHGLATRAGEAAPGLVTPLLAGIRLQHEHSMAVLQQAVMQVAPGAVANTGFYGWFENDHPAASSPADIAHADAALRSVEVLLASPLTGAQPQATEATATRFSTAPQLVVEDLVDDEIESFFGAERRHVEGDGIGALSFFAGTDTHVVLKRKERQVLRPHGHIVRTGNQLVPDESSLTSTMWMDGVFNSMVTQGHVSINRFLSTTHTYLGLFRSHGQRLFVEIDGELRLLGVPSAFAMTPRGGRWIYKYGAAVIELRSEADDATHQLRLSIDARGTTPRRFLMSHHVAMNGDDGSDAVPLRWERDERGVIVRTVPDNDVGRRFPDGSFRIDAEQQGVIESVGGDELLFLDGRSRQQPYLVIATAPIASASFTITGQLIADATGDSSARHSHLRGNDGVDGRHPVIVRMCAQNTDVACMQEILPWLEHNALVHYLAPRGLEQYSGGGWGTRDVCQGPVELLLAQGRHEPIRDLLLRVFAAQNPDGDWPQWFMFFERERSIRPDDSHGDIVFWPLLALAKYLLASDDTSILDASVPFFHGDAASAEHGSVWQHVERALAVIAGRVIEGTMLAAYGHGDWNDSLQPVDPAMREQLCSAWTVTLHYETFTTLASALRRADRDGAAELEATASRIRDDFQRLLLPDGVLTGFAYFHDDQRIDYMLHPRDQATGIHYRLLPMIHAIINDLLTPEQAAAHVGYITRYLLGSDGARLFDRPPAYRGGPQRYFQRAESSTNWGREIGLMYMHAHLRYAEAMAKFGEVDAFFLALRQFNPIGIAAAVPNARLRQSNCYYSSSDAGFADRYEAAEHYADVRDGSVPVEGGWRIYSSGAGIGYRLIHECFLGLRRSQASLTIDPVIPPRLDGLRVDTEIAGAPISVVYRIDRVGYGPTKLTLNDADLPFVRGDSSYRSGAAIVSMNALRERLQPTGSSLTVRIA